MRRLAILIALSAMMFGLQFFEVSAGSSVEPKTLAAFGFVLLAAYVIGEFAALVNLPRVTGYLVTGISFGPYAADFFSKPVADDLALINDLAVGLIALTAGGELQVGQLKKSIGSILTVIGAQVLIILPLVLGVIVVLGPQLVGWEALGIEASVTFLLALGLMIGALAVGNSPAVSVAIVNDTGSKGPFSAMNLGVTITKDLVVVVLFSVMTAIGISLIHSAGPSFGATMLHLAEEIGKSLLVGVVIGIIVIVWLRWVNAENMIFLLGIVFLGMFVGHAWHLERILVFIVAGFLVENLGVVFPNYAKLGHDMIHTIERVSPPVYVVFFAVAGARLDLVAIVEFIWIAVVIVVVRLVGMLVSTNLGARVAKLGPLFQSKLGMGFFSQAGVTLGLTLIASSKLNDVPLAEGLALGSQVFEPIVMGIVALNLLVGPVFLKMSLTASGETAEQRGDDGEDDGHGHGHGDHGHDTAVAPGEAVQPQGNAALIEHGESLAANDEPLVLPSDAAQASMVLRAHDLARPSVPRLKHEPEVEFPEVDIEPELTDDLTRLRGALEDAAARFHWNYTAHRRSDARDSIHDMRKMAQSAMQELLGRARNIDDPDSLRQWVRQARTHLAEGFYEHLSAERERHAATDNSLDAVETLIEELAALPDQLRIPRARAVPESDPLYARSGADGLYVRARKSLSRLRRRITRGDRSRMVPLRQLVEFYVTGPLPPNLVNLANVAGYQRFFYWRKATVITRFIDAALCDILRELDDPMLVEPKPVQITPVGVAPGDGDAASPGPEDHRAARRKARACVERLQALTAEIDAEFESIQTDITLYADEMHRRLRTLLASSFQHLLHALAVAGTYQLPHRRINTSRVYDRHRAGQQEIELALQRWHVATVGFSGRLLAVLDIIDLQHVAFGRVSEAEIEFANALLNDLRPVPAAVKERLARHVDEIIETLSGDSVHARRGLAMLEASREKLTEYITSSAIDRLEALRDRGRFYDLLEPFAENLSDDCMRLTHTVDVIEVPENRFEEGVTPPEPVLKTLQLRELARELLVGEALVKLGDVNAIVQRTVDMTISDLSDVQRVVGFNLDAAITELGNYLQSPESDEPLELAREFAEGGLRRSLSHVDEILANIDRAEQQIAAMLQYEIFQQLRRLRRMAIESDIGQIRSYLAQRTLEEKRAVAASGVRGFIARARGQAGQVYERGVAPVVDFVRLRLRKQLGIEEIPDVSMVELTDAARFEATDNPDVPATYRRLFAPAPVEIEEFFVGRHRELAQLRKAHDRFERGLPSSALILGEAGVGKTSFIDHALRRLDAELPVERMAFSHNFQSERQLAIQLGDLLGHRSRDLDRLRARLRNTKRRRIVVIEGLHNFCLRTLDGFAALQKFILLVSETSHIFFWVVSTDRDAWSWYRNLVPTDLFTENVELAPLGAEELRRVIEARHNVSGYHLHFCPLGSSGGDGAVGVFGEPRHEQRELLFYEALARESRGNVRLALFYWLRALRGLADDEATVEVAPLEPLETRFLDQLRSSRLIALALLIGHGGLSLPEFARVFRCSRDEAQAILTALTQTNLLYVEPGRISTYRVNPVLHRHIADNLRERRLL